MLAPALRSGANVAIIAPASALRDGQRPAFEQGVQCLKDRGLNPVFLRDEFRRYGYLADTDEARLAELNAVLQNPDIDAIFCIRGGYGTPRLLPYLDYEAARQYPKVLIGYSDITALQLALYQKAGWRSLSGHLVVEWGELSASAEGLFWDLMQGATPENVLSPDGQMLTPYRTGAAEGVLLGGNLMLINALIGTPYLPSLKGALLFLEDVGEKPYSIDRMLMHLKLAGHLDELGGVLLGGFTESETTAPTLSLEEVIETYFGQAPYPVAKDLCYGHWVNKLCMPIGIQARLRVSESQAQLQYLSPLTQGL